MQTRPRLFYSEHCNVNVLVNMSLHVFKKKNFFLILFPEGWAWPPHTEIDLSTASTAAERGLHGETGNRLDYHS